MHTPQKAPIGIRWVDINKGDHVHPEYRSRIVAQEKELVRSHATPRSQQAADVDGGHFHVRQHTALRSSAEGGNFFNGTKHKMILSCKHKYKYKKHKTSQYTATHSRIPCYVLFTFNHSNKDKLSRKIN